MQKILSKENSKLKAVRALIRTKKEREKRSAFIVEGVRALSAWTEGQALPQYRLEEVWVSEDAEERAAKFDVPVFSIPHEFMEQLSDCRTSQGILGVVAYTPVPFVIHPEQGNYLLLDRVMDPGNMGTLIRSAVAFGFTGVLLYGGCVDVFNPKTVRSTMGSLPFSNVWKIGNEGLQGLETFEYDLISTVLRDGENLYETEFGPKTVLVIGNEANGVSDEILERASRRLSIPMAGTVESLNAAVAGSICMSAIRRG